MVTRPQDWERYVEQAGAALHSDVNTWPDDAGLPYLPGLTVEATMERLARVVLSAVGPQIAEETRERTVATALRIVEREHHGSTRR